MSETEQGSDSSSEKILTGKDLIRAETSAEGRYIPYGGGSLGWFENSGILKSEKGNNYRFHAAIDTVRVRQKLFDRWGDDVNRRLDERVDIERETPLVLRWDSGETEAVTKDLSAHGARLQLLEDPGLAKEDKLTVEVKQEDGEILMTLNSEIMWVARVGKRRTVWNIGVGFTDITPDDEMKLKQFLLG